MANSLISVVILAVLVSLQVSTTLACDGYKMEVTKIENCEADPVVKIGNFTVVLNDKCQIDPNGCIENKAFTTAQVKYSIKKVGTFLKMQGEFNGCEEAKNIPDEARLFLESMKAFTKCPAPASTICALPEHVIDISSRKEFLKMAVGKVAGEIKTTHDTGKSCVKFEATLSKAGGALSKAKNALNQLKNKMKLGR